MITNILGHFHPALVHFPVALFTVGAIFEAYAVLRRQPERSNVGRALLIAGLLGAVAAVLSGLAQFNAEAYQGQTLDAAKIHRVLAFLTLGVAVGTFLIGGLGRILGTRLWLYRIFYAATAGVVGLTGHYGGWVVFGWGQIWTF